MRPPFRCLWCGEMIVPGDLMHALLPGYHFACALRVTIGSIGHLQGRCSCHRKDDSAEDDPPELTRRQGARLVADYVHQQQSQQPGRN